MTRLQGCLDDRELGELLDLSPEDPRRTHLETCARCQARLLVYQEFLEDRSVPDGADPGAAVDRLRRAFREEAIGGSEKRTKQAGRVDLGSRLRSLFAPRRRAWTAALSALALLLAVYGVTEWTPRRTEDRLRGAAPRSEFAVLGLEVTPGGSVLVRWPSVKGATAYRLIILDPAMVERARLEPVPDTTSSLSREDLPASLSSAAVEVIALSGERAIATTPPRPFRIP